MRPQETSVIVLGAGASGIAAAKLALFQSIGSVSIDDSSPALSLLLEGVTLTPRASEKTARACDILILSPGIDPHSPFVQAYSKLAGEVIGEIEWAYRFFQGKIVAITGTNGKTTTTELISKLFLQAGLQAVACGNYGLPFSEVVCRETPPDIAVLELSSFQLESIHSFHPTTIVWLNFSPDHMDRYPDEESYRAAKMRIFEQVTPHDHIIVREGEDIGNIHAPTITFSSTSSQADYTLCQGIIHYHQHPLFKMEQTHLRGLHNAENLMAALAVCRLYGIQESCIQQTLASFSPPLHRCELVRTFDGVEYINDSKATNLHALQHALYAQNRPTILLAGGKEKGLDYTSLLPALQEKTLAIICFGEIGNTLYKTFSPLKKQGISLHLVLHLQAAIELSRTLAPYGSTVLLSPGTSSFDAFSSYQERGNTFRSIVQSFR